MRMNDEITRVHGKPIRTEEVIKLLKFQGTFRNTVLQLIEIEVIRLKARAYGISINTKALDQFVAQRRRMMGIENDAQAEQYFARHGITQESWRTLLEVDLLRDQLRRRVIGPGDIKAFYRHQGDRLKSISLARIVMDNREALWTVKQSLESGDSDFYKQVMDHSLESGSRQAGGYFGVYRMGMMPIEVEQELFAAAEGELVGPFMQDGFWTLYRVLSIHAQDQDRATEDEISLRLFREWLSREVMAAKP
ncbi:MAG: peptidylprolyl isomerase [Magnetococcales bacterium]|nr:peptidylprolyl isomerase [Magnetococcales bacterium]